MHQGKTHFCVYGSDEFFADFIRIAVSGYWKYYFELGILWI